MKLLVLAQIPPPVHGQSIMVQTLVAGLPTRGVALHHVNLGLSHDAADIGRWRPGKLFTLAGACVRTVVARFRHGCDTLYYVPAPPKRAALYRDWVIMLLCRPFFSRLVLHWHASGLGEWLGTRASAPERWLSRLLLGRADLALVLGDALRADAGEFAPRRTAVVRNGIADPCAGFVRPSARTPQVRRALFLGLVVPDKGVLDAIAGTEAAGWRLVVAGAVPDPAFARELDAIARASNGRIELAGFVQGADKHRLLSEADALLFPTYYAAETQGLVVAEALAYDLPAVVTTWRAVAEDLPEHYVQRVAPRDPAGIARALHAIANLPHPNGTLRAWYLARYSLGRHLAALAHALDESPSS
jgi:glycosyltransferase involved in cell wall biosynthesis